MMVSRFLFHNKCDVIIVQFLKIFFDFSLFISTFIFSKMVNVFGVDLKKSRTLI